jgi:hypothetical protein
MVIRSAKVRRTAPFTAASQIRIPPLEPHTARLNLPSGQNLAENILPYNNSI